MARSAAKGHRAACVQDQVRARTPSVSVVICAFSDERWEHLQAAVGSVRRQSVSAAEVILVVDSNPRLLQRAKTCLSDVRVVENSGSPGAAGARNSGVAASKGDVIVFLDDDAQLAPDWLERTTTAYTDGNILGVGGMIVPIWQSGPPSWFPDEFGWVVGCTYAGMPRNAGPVRNLIAASMSVRRDVFVSVGGFREGFGNVKAGQGRSWSGLRATYGDEETELCIRALRQWPDGCWMYDPLAEAYHHVPAAKARFGYYVRRCYDEGLGKAQLARIHGGHTSLSAERPYVAKTLTSGVARGLKRGIQLGDLGGLQRASAIVVGLCAAATGYVLGISIGPRAIREQRPTARSISGSR